MAWRFKASKYKNAAPIVPKPEVWIRDICVGSYQTYGNIIAASAAFMTFNWEHAGSSLAVLHLDDTGRKNKKMPLLHAHSETVTDMEFSPFHDSLLLTGSQDCTVKVWQIPKEGLKESLSTPECTLNQRQRRVEKVGFHPTADALIHVASGHQIALWDLIKQQEAFVHNEHDEVIQSASWKKDGKLLVTSCKDKKLRILDPRANQSMVNSCNSHQNIKDSRVVWLGDQDRILSTGFDAARFRQIILRDVRNFSVPQKTIELDCSTGILMPLYDADTGMLFLAGKGDTTIMYMEIMDREPYFIEGLRHSGEQTKGACVVPKRSLRVMEGEVNRLLQLASNTLVPIMYQVPRKSYRDYHSDLYPDTSDCTTKLSSSLWLDGHDIPLGTISLDPTKNQVREVHRGSLNNVINDLLQLPSPTKCEKKDPLNSPLITSIVKTPAAHVPKIISPISDPKLEFVNVKDLVKGMEKHGDISKLQEVFPKDFEKADKCKDDDMDGKAETATNGCTESVVPKPLPRSSISESGSEERPVTPDVPKPKPRSQSTTTYKPRLGPKPFSSSQNREEFSFDRVFSVPSAPGQSPPPAVVSMKPKENGSVTSLKEIKTESPPSEMDTTKDSDSGNGKSDSSLEEEINSTDSGYKPRTPSTAERRKLFETDVLRRSNSQIEAPPSSPCAIRRRESTKLIRGESDVTDDKRSSAPPGVANRTSTVFGRVSKFRHLKCTPGHKSTHIENIKNISRQISGESNGFAANAWRCAVPIGGGGGRLAVLELPLNATSQSNGKAGSAPIPLPALLHPSALCDWAFDPFEPRRIIVATDDGTISEWILPENGLKESINTPNRAWSGHPDKIYTVKFHPNASDILITSAHDLKIKIWDLACDEPELKITLLGHTDQIFAMEWSTSGEYLATICKDTTLRVYKPRASPHPINEGKGPSGGRGGRIGWALSDTHLVVTGFDKVSERQVYVYEANNLSEVKHQLSLDVSPAILMMHIDQDSNTVFLTGRGDTTIFCVEVYCDGISALSHARLASLHQGIAFIHKHHCDVRQVEFARALRLAGDHVEPISFTVPRRKTELFQDELFPPTLVTWQPWISSAEWFNGKHYNEKRISLRPEHMELLSTHTAASLEKKNVTSKGDHNSTSISDKQPTLQSDSNRKQKQEDIFKSISARVEVNMKLEQDNMEGVDEKEWE